MIANGSRIPYVQSSASLEVPPPYHFPGVTVNAFVWEAPIDRVQAYCDRHFNLGDEASRGFVYRPLAAWPYATLMVMEYPVMISTTTAPPEVGETPYSDRGVVSQTEVFVALPVMRYGRGLPGLVTDTTLNCTLPFIVVGNPMSCVSGREMVGLGKLLAEITTGEGKFPGSFKSTVKLPGWGAPGQGTRQEMLQFMELDTGPILPTFRMGSPAQTSLATLFQSREAGWFMDSLTSALNLVDSSSSGLLPTSMRTVGLKQYRDAVDPARAIYQALVSCRSHYANMRDFAFYDERDVKIQFQDTGSFHDILSVFLPLGDKPSGQLVPIAAKAGMRFTADIDFDEMRVIHEFAIDRQGGLPPIPATSNLTARWFRPIRGFFGPRRPV